MSDLLQRLSDCSAMDFDGVYKAAHDEITRLRAQVAEMQAEEKKLRADIGTYMQIVMEFDYKAERAEAESAALRADAERYRWLRDECIPEKHPEHTWIVEAPPEDWDAAIDSARKS